MSAVRRSVLAALASQYRWNARAISAISNAFHPKELGGLAADVCSDVMVYDGSSRISEITDLIGGFHATAAGGARPVRVASQLGGHDTARFTAASGHMMTVAGGSLNLVKPYWAVSVIVPGPVALVNGRSISATGGNLTFGLLATTSHTAYNGVEFVGPLDGTAVAGTPVIDMLFSGTTAGSSRYYRNGLDKTGAVAGLSIDPLGFNIGAQTTGVEHANMDFYRLLIFRKVPSYRDVNTLTRWLRLVYGTIAIQKTIERILLNDSSFVFDSCLDLLQASEHKLQSPFSRAVLKTRASSLVIKAASNNNTGTQPPVHPEGTTNEVGVTKDGVWVGAYEVTADNATRTATTLALDGNEHTIEIVNGNWDLINKGTTAISVESPVGETELIRPDMVDLPENTMTIWTDSILSAVYADIPARDSAVTAMRKVFPGLIAVEGYGGRSIASDCDGGVNQAALVTRCAALANRAKTGGRRIIVYEPRVNDYGQNTMSPATSTTKINALINDMRTAVPGSEHWVMTTFVGGTTGANGGGFTRAQFDQAAFDVVNQQIANGYKDVRILDVRNVVTLADEPDSLHIGATGQAKIAAFFKQQMGF